MNAVYTKTGQAGLHLFANILAHTIDSLRRAKAFCQLQMVAAETNWFPLRVLAAKLQKLFHSSAG